MRSRSVKPVIVNRPPGSSQKLRGASDLCHLTVATSNAGNLALLVAVCVSTTMDAVIIKTAAAAACRGFIAT